MFILIKLGRNSWSKFWSKELNRKYDLVDIVVCWYKLFIYKSSEVLYLNISVNLISSAYSEYRRYCIADTNKYDWKFLKTLN